MLKASEMANNCRVLLRYTHRMIGMRSVTATIVAVATTTALLSLLSTSISLLRIQLHVLVPMIFQKSLLLSMASTSFFSTWPIWAKLSFALASCFILVLMMAGLVKLRKIIKMTRIRKKATADLEKANTRLRERSSDGIPFGAKAMMEDPDIDGVWNSRASTPLQSPVLEPRRSSPSRNPFSRSRRNSSVSSLSHLSLHDDKITGQPAGREAASPRNLDGTPNSTAPLFGRKSLDTPSQYKVPIHHAQNGPFPRRRSVTIRATSTQGIIADDFTQAYSQCSSIEIDSRHRGRVSTDPMPATPTRERRGRTLILSNPPADSAGIERTPTTRKALDRMEAHRKFHAAESGQLQPRLRGLGEKTPSHKHSVSDHTVSEPEITRAVSWPITPGEVLVDFNAPQKIKTKTSPNFVPCSAVVETHQLSTQPPRLPPSAWTERTQGLLEDKLGSQASRRTITIKNDSGNTSAKEYTITNAQDIRDDTELASLLGTQGRQINKGFEILPAGTLARAEPFRDFGYEPGAGRVYSDNTSRPKKLQKRNRSRSSSKGSRRSSLSTSSSVDT